MKKKIVISYIILAAIVINMTGCVKDFVDPARATQEKVLASIKGLTGIAVGLQRSYGSGRANIYNTITASGFLTGELFLLNQGNTAELQLSLGGASVDGSNTNMAGLWSTSNKIIYDADLVIENSAVITDKSYVSGLQGYVTIFKALAIGDLAMYWEKIPAGNGTNVTFITRAEGYTKALAAIDAALAAIAANPISSAFTSAVPAGIDVVNTLNALKARYALYVGNYPLALTVANAVDLSKKSVFSYDALSTNPMYSTVTSTNNIYQPVDDTFGLPVGLRPDPNDKRILFYLAINNTIAPKFRVNGFGATLTGAIPVYLPGEITLIKAEAYARAGTPTDLVNSLIEINKIITKKPANDPFGVGADLPLQVGPLTQTQLLTEIYKQRSIEMFMSGQRLEDSRRLGRPAAERKRTFLPYPNRERDQNPNTPTDPTI